jgi:hypothetical protein
MLKKMLFTKVNTNLIQRFLCGLLRSLEKIWEKCRVFSPGLLDVWTSYRQTLASPRKLKVIHSVITWSMSVSVMPLSVTEASIVLCSVSLWLMWVNVQSACDLNTRYLKISLEYVMWWRLPYIKSSKAHYIISQEIITVTYTMSSYSWY